MTGAMKQIISTIIDQRRKFSETPDCIAYMAGKKIVCFYFSKVWLDFGSNFTSLWDGKEINQDLPHPQD